MNELTDIVTVKKVLQGDMQAFSELVNAYKDLALTLAYNIVLNREDAEEIVQDAFVKAYSSLSSFKGDAKFSTWFYRIVVNTSINKRKGKKIYASIDEENVKDVVFDSSILANFASHEQKKFIKLATSALQENERVCITMYYLNELSVEEINDLTGISRANVKVLLYRGRKNLYFELRKIMKAEIKNLI